MGGAVSNTASAVGAFIAQGASAMREMNAAKKALADARDHLAELEQRIADQGEELETRQDIAGRYDQIVAEQRLTIDTAQKPPRRQKSAAIPMLPRTELKAQLEQMKEEDDATERRLKAALDAVEAREASSRETGNRLVRRLEDSKRIRDKVQAERDAGVAAAQQTVDATRAQLETLRTSMPSCSAILRRIPPITRCAPASFDADLRHGRCPAQSRGRCPEHHRRS